MKDWYDAFLAFVWLGFIALAASAVKLSYDVIETKSREFSVRYGVYRVLSDWFIGIMTMVVGAAGLLYFRVFDVYISIEFVVFVLVLGSLATFGASLGVPFFMRLAGIFEKSAVDVANKAANAAVKSLDDKSKGDGHE